MNYTTGTQLNMASADCVCAKEPQVAVPPLAEQIAEKYAGILPEDT